MMITRPVRQQLLAARPTGHGGLVDVNDAGKTVQPDRLLQKALGWFARFESHDAAHPLHRSGGCKGVYADVRTNVNEDIPGPQEFLYQPTCTTFEFAFEQARDEGIIPGRAQDVAHLRSNKHLVGSTHYHHTPIKAGCKLGHLSPYFVLKFRPQCLHVLLEFRPQCLRVLLHRRYEVASKGRDDAGQRGLNSSDDGAHC